MNFQVGQLVDIDHPLLGVVTEKIIEIKPSTYHPTDPIVFFMHEGREWGAFSSRVSIPKEEKSMTEPAATATTEPKRRGRPAKAKPEQVAPAENPFTLGQQVRAKLADGELHECTVATIESPTVIVVEASSGERFNRHVSEVEAAPAVSKLLPVTLAANQRYAVGQIVTVNVSQGLRKGVVVRTLPKPGRYAVNFLREGKTHQERVNHEQIREFVVAVTLQEGDYVGTRDRENPRFGVVVKLHGGFPTVGVQFSGHTADDEETVAIGDLMCFGSKDVARACELLGLNVHPDTVDIGTDEKDDFQTEAAAQSAPVKAEIPAPDDIPQTINNIRAEIPGTPTLFPELASGTPSPVAVGTLGVVEAPLHQLVKSPCNVRMHYDATKVEEIAASIKADGQLQEAVGRWSKDGKLEIVAGETRRRAQVLREEQGEEGLTLRVNVRELTDVQALRISAQENMQRNNMTPLEECEAMLRMHEAGDSFEDIRITFGYKTTQPVYDRVLVGKNLLTEGRDRLDSGEMSLAQAVVIARAPGKDLQSSMTQAATRGYNRASASELAKQLTQGQFLVRNAKFNVEKSGLKVKEDLFGTFEPFFEDKGAALNAQIEWAKARAEKTRKKDKHPFVRVETGSGSAYSALHGHSKYDYAYNGQNCGLIYYIDTNDGSVRDETSFRLKAAALEQAKQDGTASKDAVTREMPASAYEAAHVLRARALRHSLLGDARRTLVLTVHAQLVNYGNNYGRASIEPAQAWQPTVTTPEIEAKLTSWQNTLAAALGTTPNLAHLPGELLYGDDVNLKVYDYLSTLDEPELLDLLNVLIAARIYEPYYDVKKPAAPTFQRLAEETNAGQYLADTFLLTDEWLKRYPRQELVKIAEEAGLGRALVEDCGTLKEMRARILEHAETLHKDGFVPAIVQFGTVTDSKAVKTNAAD